MPRFTVIALALISLCALAQPAIAQVENFSGGMPPGWSLKNNSGNSNLWSVDGLPTITAGSPQQFFTPYVSPTMSLNFNNSLGHVNTGARNDYGVVSPVYDLTFAAQPVLRFQQLFHRANASQPDTYNVTQVRVWADTTTPYTNLLAEFHTGKPPFVGSPLPTFQPWAQVNIPLDRNWGPVRFEFRYFSSIFNATYDSGSTGWFIDDMLVDGLGTPVFGIATPPVIGPFEANQPINVQLTVANGTPPVASWQHTQGTLPPGVTFDAQTGQITGTATSAGQYAFKIRATDSSAPPQTHEKQFYMEITRPASFVYAVQSLPFQDDFSLDTGWVFTTGSLPSYPLTGPGAAPYSASSGIGSGWERGVTAQSPMGAWTQDQRDPPTDSSPSSDNMVMGVGVGKQWPATAQLGVRYYAYTPEIAVGGLQKITVRFQRWVNASQQLIDTLVQYYHPVTGAWTDVWVVGASPDDANNSWKLQTHDLDFGQQAAASATTRLRFGWGLKPSASSAYATGTSGGFNIDDVSVTATPVSGILNYTAVRLITPTMIGTSWPRAFVGNTYPFLMTVDNTSNVDIEVHTLQIRLTGPGGPSGTPTDQSHVAVLDFTPSFQPTGSSPWLIPPGVHDISGAAAIGLYPFNLSILAPPTGASAVYINMVLQGTEVAIATGQTIAREVFADTGLIAGGWGGSNPQMDVGQLPPIEIADPVVLPPANQGQPYSRVFTAQYGTPPYVNWQMTAGPAWLTFDPQAHSISGIPPNQGTFNLTIEVEDSASPPGHAVKNFTLDVLGPQAQPLQITSSTQFPNAVEEQPYGPATLNAYGATPPYIWSFVSGALPSGLNFVAGTASVSGTPATGTTGSYAFTVRVQDSGAPQQEVTRTFYISVLPANPTVSIQTPQSGPGSPPPGLETDPYNGGQPFRFEATGGFVTGADSYLWTIIGGAFPPGLSLNPLTGEVSGIPTTAGSYVFTLRASDGAFPPGTAQNVFTINISPLVALPMFISTNATLPIGDEGNPYFYQLKSSYAVFPTTWSLEAGHSLPSGLYLSASGEIGGTIEAGLATPPEQDYTFIVRATDNSTPPQVATKLLTLRVRAFVVGTMTITTPADLPEAGVENPYSTWLRATGGNPADIVTPYAWVLKAGSNLPNGLTMSLQGHISGMPLLGSHGIHTFEVEVTDGAGQDATREFTIQINGYGAPPPAPEDELEIVPGTRRTEMVPFWENCIAVPGVGGPGLLVMGVLALTAAIRRRRRE